MLSELGLKLVPVRVVLGRTEPLSGWAVSTRNGWLRRVEDDEIKERVLELHGSNPACCSISLPARLDGVVGIKHPGTFVAVLRLVSFTRAAAL